MGDVAESDEKTAYERKAEAKLDETKLKIEGVKARVREAVVDDGIVSGQLAEAERQIDAYVRTAQERLDRIKDKRDEDQSEDTRESLRDEMEESWEDLTQIIKKFMNRFA